MSLKTKLMHEHTNNSKNMFSFSRYTTSSRQVFRNYYLCPRYKNRVATFLNEYVYFEAKALELVLITTHNISRVICYIDGTFEPGNSLNVAVTAVVGQHSRVTVHCYPLTS